MAFTSIIDTHPQKDRIIEALVRGDTVDQVAAWVKPKIHRTTIFRYVKHKIAPAVRRQSEIAKVLRENEMLRSSASTDEGIRSIVDATKASINADPILDKVDFLWSEAKSGLSDARDAGDLSARSRFLSVGAKIVDTEGKARLHPGFAPAVPQGNTTINQLVLMPTPEQRAALMAPQSHSDIVDAEFYDVPSSEG